MVVLDQGGRILFRRGHRDNSAPFDPPVVLNPDPRWAARGLALVRTSAGLRLAALDARESMLSIYAAGPGGTFSRVGDIPIPGLLPVQLVSGDVNGDGRDDLGVVCGGSSQVLFALQDASGSFRPGSWARFDVGKNPSALALADLNGGGRPGLVVASQFSGGLTVIENRSSPAPAPPLQFRAGTGLYGVEPGDDGLPSVRSLGGPTALLIGPFVVGDVADAVVLDGGSRDLELLRGDGRNGFLNPEHLLTFAPDRRPIAMTSGDFNGDGKPDLAILNAGTQTVSILLGDGLGAFTFADEIDAGPDPGGLSLADINGNGKPELLVGNGFGDVLVLQGNGDGTFRPFREADQAVALAVIDHSGRKEFIFADQGHDRVTVQRGVTATVLGDHSRGLLAPGAVTQADLNRDGIPDLIVANSGSNNVLVYPGLGDGLYAPALNGGRGFFAGTNPVGITVADVNGDGRPDLVVANTGSNDVSVLLNQDLGGGGFAFAQGPRLKVGYGPVSTVVGDVNGDGIPDLMVSNSLSNNVSLLPGLGQGFFNDQNPTTFPVGNGPGPLFVGNFDGKPDLVTVNAGSNDLTLISGFNGPSPVTRTLPSGGLGPVAAIEFRSGTGFDNLVVANNGDGLFSLLEGGPLGLSLTATATNAGLSSPSSLALSAFTGGAVDVYATTQGREHAFLLSFALGGVTAAGADPSATGTAPGNKALLTPLRESALALIGTLLIVAVESSNPEFGPNESARADNSATVSFLSGPSGPAGQALILKSNDDLVVSVGGKSDEEREVTAPPVGEGSPPWERFLLDIDGGLKRLRSRVREQLFRLDPGEPIEEAPLPSPGPLPDSGQRASNSSAAVVLNLNRDRPDGDTSAFDPRFSITQWSLTPDPSDGGEAPPATRLIVEILVTASCLKLNTYQSLRIELNRIMSDSHAGLS